MVLTTSGARCCFIALALASLLSPLRTLNVPIYWCKKVCQIKEHIFHSLLKGKGHPWKLWHLEFNITDDPTANTAKKWDDISVGFWVFKLCRSHGCQVWRPNIEIDKYKHIIYQSKDNSLLILYTKNAVEIGQKWDIIAEKVWTYNWIWSFLPRTCTKHHTIKIKS